MICCEVVQRRAMPYINSKMLFIRSASLQLSTPGYYSATSFSDPLPVSELRPFLAEAMLYSRYE